MTDKKYTSTVGEVKETLKKLLAMDALNKIRTEAARLSPDTAKIYAIANDSLEYLMGQDND